VLPSSVLSLIDPSEVIDLALELGNIDSPTGSEGAAAERVFTWLAANGFEPRRHALSPDRFSVSATIEGSGGGYGLILNGHLDTTLRPDAIWSAKDPNERLYRSAWLDGEHIVGDGVVNDKGPVAAFLVAAKAIKAAGLNLLGDITVTAVAGEIGREPVDEYQGIDYVSKDLGTRFMVTHGVVADFALVAEGTGFGTVWAEPGMSVFKVSVYTDGPRYYTPYLPPRAGLNKSPNAIVLAAAAIAAFEDWAAGFQERFREDRAGGVIIPKASVNAVRSGYPFEPTSAPQVASLYVDTYLPPGANPNDIREELRQILHQTGIAGKVELVVYRPGFEAIGVDRLVDSIRRCHRWRFGTSPAVVGPEVSSMWRDTNAFIELGIPAVSYAPRSASHASRKAVRSSDLVDASAVYAAIACDIANQPREPWTRLGSHLNSASDSHGITANERGAANSGDPQEPGSRQPRGRS
jgi:acetylornithine deacetylase/succinyl-diaminopimelate desuccinylase-like protein